MIKELTFKDGRKLDVAYPIQLKDSRGNEVYFENCHGTWTKYEFDSNDNEIYAEYSTGFWIERKYNEKDQMTYLIDSNGFWQKQQYNPDNGFETYYENSYGDIRGKPVAKVLKPAFAGKISSLMAAEAVKNVTVEMTMEEISKAIGKNVKVIK